MLTSTHVLALAMALSAWIVGSSAFRFHKVSRRYSGVSPSTIASGQLIPAAMMLVAGLLLSAGMLWGARVFYSGKIFTAINILACAILNASILDYLIARRTPATTGPSAARRLGAAGSLILTLIFFGFIFRIMTPPLWGVDKIQLDYPVRGEWVVATGGKTRHTNYHHGNPDAQNFAVDLVVRKGNSFGEPIYAPVDGRVIRAVGDRTSGSAAAEGNVIVIETSEGIEVRLAHLAQDSLQVQTGDSVTAGQPIARCGATGSATTAHLHIHAEKDGQPVAMRFGKNKRFLIRTDRIYSIN